MRLCSHRPWRLAKLLPQSKHMYFFCSACSLKRWASNSGCSWKLMAHISHEKAFLRWIHLWRCIFCRVWNILLHSGQGNLYAIGFFAANGDDDFALETALCFFFRFFFGGWMVASTISMHSCKCDLNSQSFGNDMEHLLHVVWFSTRCGLWMRSCDINADDRENCTAQKRQAYGLALWLLLHSLSWTECCFTMCLDSLFWLLNVESHASHLKSRNEYN